MQIMATGMHDTFMYRFEGQAGLFQYRQRVDIAPQADHASRPLAAHLGHEAGLKAGGQNAHAGRLKRLPKLRRRAELAAAHLRVRVQILEKRNQLLLVHILAP